MPDHKAGTDWVRMVALVFKTWNRIRAKALVGETLVWNALEKFPYPK
jgi:hypothetical protein